LFKGLTAWACALCIATPAFADSHGWSPDGPITMMIAFAAGGGADSQARALAEDIEAATGWEIVPEQVTGNSGLNLVNQIKDAPGDGTAIGMIVTETLGYNMLVSESGLTLADVTPLTTTARFQMGVVAMADRGWTDLGDVIEAAQGGEAISFGVMADRLADIAYLLGQANGVEFDIVQTRGGGDVMNGIQAGDIDIGFAAGAQARAVASGDMVNLASGLPIPLAQTPDAPLLTSYGVDFSADGFFLFVGPPNMDPAAREAITEAIQTALTTEGTGAATLVNRAFAGPTLLSGAELEAYLAEQLDGAQALLDAASQ